MSLGSRRSKISRWLRMSRACRECGADIRLITIPKREDYPGQPEAEQRERVVLIDPDPCADGWVVITPEWRTYVDSSLSMQGERYNRHRCHGASRRPRPARPTVERRPEPVLDESADYNRRDDDPVEDDDDLYARACASQDSWLARHGR